MKSKSLSKSEVAALDEIFSESPEDSEVVADFPTRGKFYGSKQVTIRSMVFEDEKAITAIKDPDLAVNTIINRCVDGLDAMDLIPCDKDYLLVKIRSLTYGPYECVITCPHCSVQGKTQINLDKMLVNKIPEDLENPRVVDLPVIKKQALVRFPTEQDFKLFQADQTLDNLWRFILEIGGKTNPKIIQEALKRMKLMDVKALMNGVKGAFKEGEDVISPGIDKRFNYICGSCKEQSFMEAPIGPDFFTPS